MTPVMNHTPEDPRISVIVVSFNERDAIERCLASLAHQVTGLPFEVILIDSSTDGTEVAARRFRFVRVHHFAERKYAGDARNLGIAVAQAGIIAFLDADCFVASDWIERLARAHEAPYLALGSVIDNGSRASLIAWAYLFCEFNLWLGAKHPREVQEMAGCGLSIKRPAFDCYGPFLPGSYCSDTAFHWRMARDGHNVLIVPELVVFHTVRYGLGGFLKHIARHRRSYALVRANEKGLTAGRRIAAAVAAGFLPPVLLGAIAWRVFKSRKHWGPFVLSCPVVLLGVLARAWGEILGYAQRRT